MIDELAKAMDRRPPIRVTVPVLTPRLSSLWVGLVTPVDTGVARPLIEGLSHETVVTDPSGMAALPARERIPLDQALREAVAEMDEDERLAPDRSGTGPPRFMDGLATASGKLRGSILGATASRQEPRRWSETAEGSGAVTVRTNSARRTRLALRTPPMRRLQPTQARTLRLVRLQPRPISVGGHTSDRGAAVSRSAAVPSAPT